MCSVQCAVWSVECGVWSAECSPARGLFCGALHVVCTWSVLWSPACGLHVICSVEPCMLSVLRDVQGACLAPGLPSATKRRAICRRRDPHSHEGSSFTGGILIHTRDLHSQEGSSFTAGSLIHRRDPHSQEGSSFTGRILTQAPGGWNRIE